MNYAHLLAGLANHYVDPLEILAFCYRADVRLLTPEAVSVDPCWETVFLQVTDPIERQKLLDRARIEHFAVFREAAPEAVLDDVLVMLDHLAAGGVTFRTPFLTCRGRNVRGAHLKGDVAGIPCNFEVRLATPVPLDTVLPRLQKAGVPLHTS